MGIELTDMELEDLDDILREISKANTRDMSTFKEVLLEMYGGLDIKQYQKLEAFIRREMGLNSDSELWNMDKEQRIKVIEYLQ
jgi:hypothetical protein